eukprot:scaffold283118_cov32-Tisochrysis_lutea.AAC.1
MLGVETGGGCWRRTWRRRHVALTSCLAAAAMLLLPALLREKEATAQPDRASALAGVPSLSGVDELLPPVPLALRNAEHLIVVAGHAVYTASDRGNGRLQQEASWFLEPFQRGELARPPQACGAMVSTAI